MAHSFFSAQVDFWRRTRAMEQGFIAGGLTGGWLRCKRWFAFSPLTLTLSPLRGEGILIPARVNSHCAGAIIPGYPALHPLADDFWPLFWKLFQQMRQPEAGERKLPLRSSKVRVS